MLQAHDRAGQFPIKNADALLPEALRADLRVLAAKR
jgi:hypothetical protein